MAGSALFGRRFARQEAARSLLPDRLFQANVPLLAKMLETLIHDNAGNPGTETCLFAEGVQAPEFARASWESGLLRSIDRAT